MPCLRKILQLVAEGRAMTQENQPSQMWAAAFQNWGNGHSQEQSGKLWREQGSP